MKTYFVHSWPEIAAYTETGSSGAQHRTGGRGEGGLWFYDYLVICYCISVDDSWKWQYPRLVYAASEGLACGGVAGWARLTGTTEHASSSSAAAS